MKVIFKILGIGCLSVILIIGVFILWLFFPPDIRKSKQPYRKGDEIILESSFGQIDKITIISVKNWSISAAPFSIFSKKILKVKAKREILKKSDKIDLYCKNDKGELQYIGDRYYKFRGRFSEPYIFLSLNDEGVYDELGISNDLCSDASRDMFGQEQIEQYNAYEIVNEYTSGHDHALSYIWWHKKYGYIKYGLVNGDYWQIREFNGVDVFQKISK